MERFGHAVQQIFHRRREAYMLEELLNLAQVTAGFQVELCGGRRRIFTNVKCGRACPSTNS